MTYDAARSPVFTTSVSEAGETSREAASPSVGGYAEQVAALSPQAPAHTYQNQAAAMAPLQCNTGEVASGVDAHAIAARGVHAGGGALPFAERIQASFGRFDVSGIRAHTDGAAADATSALGAKGYAHNGAVALAPGADLHTVAHEAAHVVQQRGGLQLKGGVGKADDQYEQHADAVADAVVAGESAVSLLENLDGQQPGATSSRATQLKEKPGEKPGKARKLSKATRNKLIADTKAVIPYAAMAFMNACSNKEAELGAAVKKKVDVAGLVFDVAMAFIPPAVSTGAKNLLQGVNSTLEGEALEAAVKAAENSLRGGAVRAEAKGWSGMLKKGLQASVKAKNASPGSYVKALRGLAPEAYRTATNGIDDKLSDADLLAQAVYWQSKDVVDVAYYEGLIAAKVAALQLVTGAITAPGIKWGTPPSQFGQAVFCVNRRGRPTKNRVGGTMAVVNFLNREDTSVIFYVPAGMENAAIAKHVEEYGTPPRDKYVCRGGRASRYQG